MSSTWSPGRIPARRTSSAPIGVKNSTPTASYVAAASSKARMRSEGIADPTIRRHPLDELGEGRDVASLVAGAVAHVQRPVLGALDLLQVGAPEDLLGL